MTAVNTYFRVNHLLTSAGTDLARPPPKHTTTRFLALRPTAFHPTHGLPPPPTLAFVVGGGRVIFYGGYRSADGTAGGTGGGGQEIFFLNRAGWPPPPPPQAEAMRTVGRGNVHRAAEAMRTVGRGHAHGRPRPCTRYNHLHCGINMDATAQM